MVKPSKKPRVGKSANQSIFARAKDQAVGFVKNRYASGNMKSNISNIAKDVMMLKSVLNTEDKHNDVLSFGNTATQSVPYQNNVCLLPEGSDSINRTGRSVKLNKIDLLMEFTFSQGALATAANSNQIYRWFLLQYLKTPSSGGSGNPLITEFLNNDPGGFISPMSLPNTDTNEDYRVLAQGQVDVVLPIATTVTTARSQIVDISVPVNIHQTYNGTAAANISDNAILLYCVALNPTNAGGVSNFGYSVRTWFIDN
jgi:hypothetical protein